MGLYKFAGPMLRLLAPETAHGLALFALKHHLLPKKKTVLDPILSQKIWGLDFVNPVGLAAGFDKNADVPNAMMDQGFGFVEIGSVTPKAQPGNPQPRLFRLSEDQAVINRMGFNNEGIEAVKARLAVRPAKGVLGVNLGKNKTQEDALADYRLGVSELGPYSDYMVINVSSPNTPGLRALQNPEHLQALLDGVIACRDALEQKTKPPVLLKVAPDLTDEDRTDIVATAIRCKIDGLIVSNTTIARPDSLQSRYKSETGGLSGQPLFEPSTEILKDFARTIDGRFPVIGVGGIASADQAYQKILAGACLVQLYSALIYHGTDLVEDINQGLAERLKADGFSHISHAVGRDL